MSETKISQSQINKSPWQQPADWPDIRQGAIANSIYALVGHSLDYSQYNELPIFTEIIPSGTYDVYIDGVKKYSAVASSTWTIINWQSLNLDSGFIVTYPTTMRVHVIRVTPTVNTNTFRYPSFTKDHFGDTGVLWLHFTFDYGVWIPNMCRHVGSDTPLLEAFTTSTGIVKTEWMGNAFTNSNSLQEIPIIEIIDGYADYYGNFYNTKIKKLEYKLDVALDSTRSITETNLPECTEIINTTQYPLHTSSFENCPKLKRISAIIDTTWPTTMDNFFGGCVSMEDTSLDFSNGSQVKRLKIGGTETVPLPWFKGLTVSDSAPFDGIRPQLDVSYTGMSRAALITLFNSMPYNVGYKITGNITVNNGIATGFGTGNYLTIPTATLPNYTVMEGRVTATVIQTGHINDLISIGGAYANGLSFELNDTSMSIRFRYTKYSDNSAQYAYFSLNSKIQTDTPFVLNFAYNKTTREVSGTVTQGGQTLSTFSLSDVREPTNYTNCHIGFSFSSNYSPDLTYDLNNTDIKFDNVPWFTGKEAMIKTCTVVGCTGTADLTQEDRDIVEDKGWELLPS